MPLPEAHVSNPANDYTEAPDELLHENTRLSRSICNCLPRANVEQGAFVSGIAEIPAECGRDVTPDDLIAAICVVVPPARMVHESILRTPRALELYGVYIIEGVRDHGLNSCHISKTLYPGQVE